MTPLVELALGDRALDAREAEMTIQFYGVVADRLGEVRKLQAELAAMPDVGAEFAILRRLRALRVPARGGV